MTKPPATPARVNTKRSKSPQSVLMYGSRGGRPYCVAYLPTTLTSIPVHASFSFACVVGGIVGFGGYSSAYTKGARHINITKTLHNTMCLRDCCFIMIKNFLRFNFIFFQKGIFQVAPPELCLYLNFISTNRPLLWSIFMLRNFNICCRTTL